MSRIVAFTACFTAIVICGFFILPVNPLISFGSSSSPPQTEAPYWPPKVGVTYPDWRLYDTDGDEVQLSSFRGKVILVELIGIPCKGCQAYSGGHQCGPFAGVQPQPKIKSLAEYFPRFAGMQMDDPRIHFVQILLFDKTARRLPTVQMAKEWEQHFQLHNRSNATVLVGHIEMHKRTTKSMIPGFHLIDREFRLRMIAGKPPRSDLYTDLLRNIPTLLENSPRG